MGLGKTVQAGLLMRQARLSGRARRMLVMAPASVLKQWQRELREKFGLDWPIYSGKALEWQATCLRPKSESRHVGRAAPLVIWTWRCGRCSAPQPRAEGAVLRRLKAAYVVDTGQVASGALQRTSPCM